MAETAHYVVGGEYASTAFSKIAAGHSLEIYGPYTPGEAFAVWRAISAKTVDNAMTRYEIVTADRLEEIRATV
jgi:hypothetical protein